MNRLADNRAEQVAFSRFFNNAGFDYQSLAEALCSGTNQWVSGKHMLVLNDTSELIYQSHSGMRDRSDKELGPVGNNADIGFFIHPSLVVDAHAGFPLGFSHIHCWNRRWDKQDKDERNYRRPPIEQKESYRWIESARKSVPRLTTAETITIVGDRESNIYEEFALIPDERTHLLIRVCRDRRLIDQDQWLYEYLSTQPKAGSYHVDIKGDKRMGRTSRKALLEVRYTRVKIKRPRHQVNAQSYPEYVELTAVEVKENAASVPPGEEAILWRLLTTHPVNCFEDACQIIRWYSLRWLIEQLFRTLKSEGLDVESSQIRSGSGLKKLVVMALQAALAIMQLVQKRDGKYGINAGIMFNEDEVACLDQLERTYEGKTKAQKNPYSNHSLAWAGWMIARMGGWKGYQSGSPPGPITFKRGLAQFKSTFSGWKLARDVCIE